MSFHSHSHLCLMCPQIRAVKFFENATFETATWSWARATSTLLLWNAFFKLIIQHLVNRKNLWSSVLRFEKFSTSMNKQKKNWTLFSSIVHLLNSPGNPQNSVMLKFFEKGHTFISPQCGRTNPNKKELTWLQRLCSELCKGSRGCTDLNGIHRSMYKLNLVCDDVTKLIFPSREKNLLEQYPRYFHASQN